MLFLQKPENMITKVQIYMKKAIREPLNLLAEQHMILLDEYYVLKPFVKPHWALDNIISIYPQIWSYRQL